MKALFERVLCVPQAERETFLEASGANAETIAEVRSLLAFYEEAPEFLEEGSCPEHGHCWTFRLCGDW